MKNSVALPRLDNGMTTNQPAMSWLGDPSDMNRLSVFPFVEELDMCQLDESVLYCEWGVQCFLYLSNLELMPAFLVYLTLAMCSGPVSPKNTNRRYGWQRPAYRSSQDSTVDEASQW